MFVLIKLNMNAFIVRQWLVKGIDDVLHGVVITVGNTYFLIRKSYPTIIFGHIVPVKRILDFTEGNLLRTR